MKKTPRERGILVSALLAQAVWASASLLLLFIFCLIAYSTADPDSVTEPLSLTALYLGGLIGGIAAVRYSADGLAAGLISGLFTAILVFSLGCLPFPSCGRDFGMRALLVLPVIPCAVIGSLVGRRRKNGRIPKKKKIR